MHKQLHFEFLPKIWTSLLYLFFIFAALFVYLSKYWGIKVFTSLYPDFYLHISNFAITLIFGLLGYFWLLMGVKFIYICYLHLFLLFINILSETVLKFMNTPDLIDMIFGFFGALVSFFTLLLIYKYGLDPNH